MSNAFDWDSVARKLLLEKGFQPDYSAPIRSELAAITDALPDPSGPVKDLRSLLWSSIDNADSRDLDQVEWAQPLPNGETLVRVGIADVDVRVPQHSAIDARASNNTTTVYTGVLTFPMLPEVLSTDLTSCNQDQDRFAIVAEYVVRADGDLGPFSAYPALLRNRARLTYEQVAAFLEGEPSAAEEVARIEGLREQLRLQNEASLRLRARRKERGALEIETTEAHTVVRDGQVVGVEVVPKLRSRELVEDFMIAANRTIAGELDRCGRNSIGRVVEKPKRWDRIVQLALECGDSLPAEPDPVALSDFMSRRRAADPEGFPQLSLAVVKSMGPGVYKLRRPGDPWPGHFGLAVQDYTHSTAPNRRFSDLVTQRLLKAAFHGRPSPYDEATLAQIAQRCTDKENDARHVERQMRKVAMAVLLRDKVGEVFEAIVTGAADKGTFVRLISPPAEGRVVQGERGLDVGDHVKVRLLATAPERGFIDFARA